MPHKRNPIVSERICGIARLLRGYAQVGLENVALWHERDISHSSAERVAFPDACILLDYAQHLAIRVVDGMTVHTDRMRANLEVTSGALFSQRALLALVESGLSRDDAYRIVQENAQRAWDSGTPFRALLDEAHPGLDLDAIFDPAAFTTHAGAIIGRLDDLAELPAEGIEDVAGDPAVSSATASRTRPSSPGPSPQSVWPMTTTSVLPIRRDASSERSTSSVTIAPALRST
jgi:adenylosuccinate lyase